jgi:hypothetical protein
VTSTPLNACQAQSPASQPARSKVAATSWDSGRRSCGSRPTTSRPSTSSTKRAPGGGERARARLAPADVPVVRAHLDHQSLAHGGRVDGPAEGLGKLRAHAVREDLRDPHGALAGVPFPPPESPASAWACSRVAG